MPTKPLFVFVMKSGLCVLSNIDACQLRSIQWFSLFFQLDQSNLDLTSSLPCLELEKGVDQVSEAFVADRSDPSVYQIYFPALGFLRRFDLLVLDFAFTSTFHKICLTLLFSCFSVSTLSL